MEIAGATFTMGTSAANQQQGEVMLPSRYLRGLVNTGHHHGLLLLTVQGEAAA